ncbi:filamentous hemagglutinin N-terminal domain-containing protein [Chlorogloeopsis fritschii PCC 9212]|uniref:two-partner secretion domain-containing protein n=1 Tax=Chlorogloeopsis fritschii TaxID=1124 RepID=UPI001F456B43|nr:filamentous hemagglutinin N-terminal domain-containing protein [Chlorogloeopsis fritschii]
MMKPTWSLFFTTLSLAILGSLAPICSATAQIVEDSSLDATGRSSITRDVLIRNIISDRIDGGTTSGSNLFHSFEEFNVGAGRGVYFSNPAGIENILTRITGGNPSNIRGTLGVVDINNNLGTANLFLINPNGIIFGANARLDLGGSFFGSTANSIVFDNGFEFSATNPQAPLLTVNIPVGLRFRDNPGNITTERSVVGDSVFSSFLSVQPQKTLALVGGNVSLDGGILYAPGGRIELGGLSTAGTVGINNDGSLSFPDGVARGDVSFTNRVIAYVAAGGGGDIAVNARNLDVLEGSDLVAGIEAGSGTPNAQSGDIVINATDKLRIEGDANSLSRIRNIVDDGALGNTGNIDINTAILEGTGRFIIGSVNSGQGNSGKISITAKDKVAFLGLQGFSSGIISAVNSEVRGSTGDIIINTPSFSLFNSGITTSTFGQGNVGNVLINASDSISIDGNSFIQAINFGFGDSGKIDIFAPEGSIFLNQASITTLNTGTGTAGTISINARDQVSINQSTISSEGKLGRILIGKSDISGATYSPKVVNIDSSTLSTTNDNVNSAVDEAIDAGDISIDALDTISINQSFIQAFTRRKGNAGNVTLRAENGDISMNNGSRVFSSVERDQGDAGNAVLTQGNAGDINIKARSVSLNNGSALSSSTFGQGNAGNIEINASDTVSFDGVGSNGFFSGAFSTVEPGAIGKGGNINVTARSLSLTNNAVLNTATSGQAGETGRADAGNIQVNVSDEVFLGSGGQLRSDTYGQGNAGNVTIEGRDGILPVVRLDGVGLVNNVQRSSGVSTSVGNDQNGLVGNGKAGDIAIRGRSLSLTEGGALVSSTFGKGDAGNIEINVSDTVSLDGISSAAFSTVEPGAIGKGGNINVTARSLSLTNGAKLNTATFGNGDAGNVSVQVDDAIKLADYSFITSNVGPQGEGLGGNINITAKTLSLTNGAEVLSQTRGNGKAGNIQVNVTDSVVLRGVAPFPKKEDGSPGGFSSGFFTSTEAGANGEGGNITVTTGNLRISDGAVLSARSRSSFNGGNITVNANTLDVSGGGQILTTTFKSGNAGNITVNVRDRITISGSDPTFSERFKQLEQAFPNGNQNFPNGRELAEFTIDPVSSESGIFANTAPGSTGKGGDIFIDPKQVTIKDGGTITATSAGTGEAGNVTLVADNLTLDRGKITAESGSTTGGNINLDIKDLLLLRRNSQISATAGREQGGGDGGNVKINTGFLVAFPKDNSDITANAFTGSGGRVDIQAESIFGIEPRDRLTPFSDITASSELGVGGSVSLNTPEVDPSKGLVELPETVVDPQDQIAQNPCQKLGGSEFIITGRGGLPPSPNQSFNSNNVRVDLVNPAISSGNFQSATINQPTISSTTKQVVPAQGWVFNDKGDVVLTAYDPTATHLPQRASSKATAACPAPF